MSSPRAAAWLISAALIALLSCCVHAQPLDPSCAPGGNFDLTHWALQTHIGAPYSPDTIPSTNLAGCSGFQNTSWFFTSPTDGAMVFRVPGSTTTTGCVTTKNSLHCRTELRENVPSNFNPNATRNRLRATLKVTLPDESERGTVVGQILADASDGGKPVCELYYNATGVLTLGVGVTRAGGQQIFTRVGEAVVGSKFSYEVRYEGGMLSVGMGGEDGVLESEMMVNLDTFELQEPLSYMKAGAYDQGDGPCEVHFYKLETEHVS